LVETETEQTLWRRPSE